MRYSAFFSSSFFWKAVTALSTSGCSTSRMRHMDGLSSSVCVHSCVFCCEMLMASSRFCESSRMASNCSSRLSNESLPKLLDVTGSCSAYGDTRERLLGSAFISGSCSGSRALRTPQDDAKVDADETDEKLLPPGREPDVNICKTVGELEAARKAGEPPNAPGGARVRAGQRPPIASTRRLRLPVASTPSTKGRSGAA
ncbi:hypothetical protein PRNP1_011356 [Phytophthora ramorum]